MSSFVTITNEHYNRLKAENKRLKEFTKKVQTISDRLGAALFTCSIDYDGTKDVRKGIGNLNKLCQALQEKS